MKLITLGLFYTFLIQSCSQINVESKDFYQKNKEAGHGIVPIASNIPNENAAPEKGVDLQASKRGKVIYQNNCLKCHGKNGKGDGPMANKLKVRPRDLTILIKTTPHFEFFLSVSQWKGKMPGWSNPDLTEKDLRDITHYLKVLAKAN